MLVDYWGLLIGGNLFHRYKKANWRYEMMYWH
jgi:hypothetical protein